MKQHSVEVTTGQRFEFGENWDEFLTGMNEQRILAAEASLKRMLRVDDLAGLRYLDIGSGSGLFSLAARRLGAMVHSFDFDPQSVACTEALRQRYYPDDRMWTIQEGSVLDAEFVESLGQFDIVYSWGVLHHTGAMWQAIENAGTLVCPGGQLFIAIYNDQGGTSRRWRAAKRAYCRLPKPFRFLIVWPCLAVLWLPHIARDTLRGNPLRSWVSYARERGMSPWRDVIDWVGGYPFEVAKPEEIFDYYRERGFELTKLVTFGGTHGCNQFVFRKTRARMLKEP